MYKQIFQRSHSQYVLELGQGDPGPGRLSTLHTTAEAMTFSCPSSNTCSSPPQPQQEKQQLLHMFPHSMKDPLSWANGRQLVSNLFTNGSFCGNSGKESKIYLVQFLGIGQEVSCGGKGARCWRLRVGKEVKTAEETRVNNNQGFALSFLLNWQLL